MGLAGDQQVHPTAAAVVLEFLKAGVRQLLDERHGAEVRAADGEAGFGQLTARDVEHGGEPFLAVLAAVAVEEDVDVLLELLVLG